MPSDNCPTLTPHGAHVIDENIKNALQQFVVLGARRNEFGEQVRVQELIGKNNTLYEDIERFIVTQKRPLSVFFAKDGRLTARVNIAYDDLTNKQVTIEGLVILDQENKIVGMYPWKAALEGEQARVEAIIKISSVVGEPGTVIYYTGEYMTREEYEAARVPMVEKVYADAMAKLEPGYETSINNFNTLSQELRDALEKRENDYMEDLKIKTEALLAQSTKDLHGVLDTAALLVKETAFEENFKRLVKDLEDAYKFRSAKIRAAMKRIAQIEEDYNSLGKMAIFVEEIPDDYIYFNTWYDIIDHLCFVNRFKSMVTLSSDKRQFMVRWNLRNVYGQTIDGLYLKARMGAPVHLPATQFKQQAPNPSREFYLNDELSSDTALFFPEPKWGTYGAYTNGYTFQNGGQVTRSMTINSRDPYDSITQRINCYLKHAHSVTYTNSSNNNYLKMTYIDDHRASIETEHMQVVIAIKAGFSKEVITYVNDVIKADRYDFPLVLAS